MRKPLVASIAITLGVALAALMGTGVASTSALGSGAHQQAQAAAAHQAFVKYMSSHATMMRATGKNATLASSSGVTEVGSFNWSGFADVQTGATPVSSVSGRWTIPEVDCLGGEYANQDAFLAQWVGLDGFTSGTVEQLGTATQCYEGVEYYYVWYEMFPGGTVEEGTVACINLNTHCPRPGDEVRASVVSTNDGAGKNDYTLALSDTSRPSESFSISASCPDTTCVNSSAEWIVERPAFDLPFGFQILPQAEYDKTAFRDGTVSAGGVTSTIENYSGAVYDIAMIDDSQGYFLSCPGQTGRSGQLLLLSNAAACPPVSSVNGEFRDTWDSSF
jgi:hypothetical protein